MNDTISDTRDSGSGTDDKGSEARRARSIRFSDSEWETVEKAAAQRGMNAAELVRHATLGRRLRPIRRQKGRLPAAIGGVDRAHFPQHPQPRDTEAR